jgi:hypothetical protein
MEDLFQTGEMTSNEIILRNANQEKQIFGKKETFIIVK